MNTWFILMGLLSIGSTIWIGWVSMKPATPKFDPQNGNLRIRIEGPKGKLSRYSWKIVQVLSSGSWAVKSGTTRTKERAVKKAQKFIQVRHTTTYEYPVRSDGSIDSTALETEQWGDEFKRIDSRRSK